MGFSSVGVWGLAKMWPGHHRRAVLPLWIRNWHAQRQPMEAKCLTGHPQVISIKTNHPQYTAILLFGFLFFFCSFQLIPRLTAICQLFLFLEYGIVWLMCLVSELIVPMRMASWRTWIKHGSVIRSVTPEAMHRPHSLLRIWQVWSTSHRISFAF